MSLEDGALDFVELAPENYYGLGGRWKRRLDAVKSKYSIVTHGLALSLGGADPLDASLIEAIASIAEEVSTPWHSDHLCWSASGDSHLHELLPMEMTREALAHTAERIRTMQAELPVPFAIENVSAYARRPADTYSEPDFISELVERTGCKILLDVNNVYVNATNFGHDPQEFLDRFPCEAATQIHIAGFLRESSGLLIDTHGEPVADPVWPLLERALKRTGPVPVLLERDHNFPPLQELLAEVQTIRNIGAKVFDV